jgi:hypothetical protein
VKICREQQKFEIRTNFEEVRCEGRKEVEKVLKDGFNGFNGKTILFLFAEDSDK